MFFENIVVDCSLLNISKICMYIYTRICIYYQFNRATCTCARLQLQGILFVLNSQQECFVSVNTIAWKCIICGCMCLVWKIAMTILSNFFFLIRRTKLKEIDLWRLSQQTKTRNVAATILCHTQLEGETVGEIKLPKRHRDIMTYILALYYLRLFQALNIERCMCL